MLAGIRQPIRIEKTHYKNIKKLAYGGVIIVLCCLLISDLPIHIFIFSN